MQKKSCGTN